MRFDDEQLDEALDIEVTVPKWIKDADVVLHSYFREFQTMRREFAQIKQQLNITESKLSVANGAIQLLNEEVEILKDK